MKFRERLYRFMQGRYGAGGADAFTRFLSVLTFIFILLSFFRVPFTYLLAIGLIVYMYFRLLSRNYYKRQQENNFYLKQEYKVKNFFARTKKNLQQMKTHHIYRCPTCKQRSVFQGERDALKSDVRNAERNLLRKASTIHLTGERPKIRRR